MEVTEFAALGTATQIDICYLWNRKRRSWGSHDCDKNTKTHLLYWNSFCHQTALFVHLQVSWGKYPPVAMIIIRFNKLKACKWKQSLKASVGMHVHLKQCKVSRDMTPIYLPIMVSIVEWIQCDRRQAAHTSLFLDLTSLRKKGRCLEPKRKDRTSYMCILCTYVWFMYDTSSVNTPHGRVGNGPGDLYIWVTQTSSSSFWLIALKSSLINFDCRTNTSSFSVSCKNQIFTDEIPENSR